MKISVFGLGYVGAVTAGCLASRGHTIVGVDVQQEKVDAINAGHAPIIEPGLPELMEDGVRHGRIKATLDCDEAIRETEASIVCVGTPSAESGALDLGFIRQVSAQIAAAVQAKASPHRLLFRSTMLPGSTRSLVEEVLVEAIASGNLDVFYYPEFLREGTAVDDFQDPSLVVLGTRDGDEPEASIRSLVGKCRFVNWETAEMIKYACNAFHATKITFANEIGRLGKRLGVDARAVMDLVSSDTKLNISSYYMRPGNPFGGSCLPKDVRALSHCARQSDVHVPLVENLLASNEDHLGTLIKLIKATGKRDVAILGLSFKSNTDDLRESSMVEVAQRLLGQGHTIRIFDPQLNLSKLIGSNKRVIDEKMPHLASLLHTDLATTIGSDAVVVAAQRCASLEELKPLLTTDHHVIDINNWNGLAEIAPRYEGLCW